MTIFKNRTPIVVRNLHNLLLQAARNSPPLLLPTL